mmetsp:Transcript_13946/g.32461  ORF Transcript_13946/g.32461 Transcript_13946/m.32461 type:complete len:530 (-) Transcript_13946:314-1903(-)
MEAEISSKTKPVTNVKESSGSSNVPSGFILKLYQMVNGAPNEIITWTPSGDAFIIGSDLNRLESETLPQYFRHNRFQSLVRQLNFYSFRKINRERNVWIYKHNLFHRDRPEDLHQVRRRTCPGVDGRKQRFSRLSAQKLSKKFEEGGANVVISNDSSEGENDTSSEDDSIERQQQQHETDDAGIFGNELLPSLKRGSSNSHVNVGHMRSSKKARLLPEPDFEIDTSIISNPAPSPTSVKALIFEDEESGDDKSTCEKSAKTEMLEQSLIVSEVATKLDSYVKKALKKRGISRTRRGGSGIVTPPFGSSFTMTSRDLITYDDEYNQHGSTSDVVPDSEEVASEEDSSNTPTLDKDMLVAPVLDLAIVKHISSEIAQRANSFNGEAMRACANVAAFFMCTAPKEDPEQCSSKVLQLLATSRELESEFYFYRSALHPALFLESSPHGRSSGSADGNLDFTDSQSAALRNTLVRGAGRLESLREFKVFAVNLIYKLLRRNGAFAQVESLSSSDNAILLHTAEIWSKSVGIGVF